MTPRLFVVVALIIGLAFVFLTPPFGVPDEQNHFWRALAIAHGHLTAAHGRDATTIARSVQNFVWVLDRAEPRESLREKLRVVASLPFDGQVGGDVRFAAWYTPMPYIVQSVVAAMPLRPIVLFYGGRIANLLAAILLIALAIRAAPRRATAFAAALLPMTLYELASWSPDAAPRARHRAGDHRDDGRRHPSFAVPDLVDCLR